MEKNNLQELVSKALDYDQQACLELAVWYRRQGNSDMAEHFEKKSTQNKEDLDKATALSVNEYQGWREEQSKYYAEAMRKVKEEGIPICMLCTQINRITMLYWLITLGLGEDVDIEDFPYSTDDGSEHLYEAAQSFMKIHELVHIEIYNEGVVEQQFVKYGIKDFFLDFEEEVSNSILEELHSAEDKFSVKVHLNKY